MGATVSEQPRRNPSSFADALTKLFYAKDPTKQQELRREREQRVAWLRKKCKASQPALDLAEKLDACHRKRRCKSGACPVCVDAAQRLFAKASKRYLKGKSNIFCVTIIPSTEITRKGKLS